MPQGKPVVGLPHRAVEHPPSPDRRLRSLSPRPRTPAPHSQSPVRRPRSPTPRSSPTTHGTLELKHQSPATSTSELPAKDRHCASDPCPDGLQEVGPHWGEIASGRSTGLHPLSSTRQAGTDPHPYLASHRPGSVGRLRPRWLRPGRHKGDGQPQTGSSAPCQGGVICHQTAKLTQHLQ